MKLLADQISIVTLAPETNWVTEIAGAEIIRWGVKGGLIIGLTMYCLFALVIIKQVGIMAQTYEAEANGVVRIFAWAHLIMALVLLGAGILLL